MSFRLPPWHFHKCPQVILLPTYSTKKNISAGWLLLTRVPLQVQDKFPSDSSNLEWGSHPPSSFIYIIKWQSWKNGEPRYYFWLIHFDFSDILLHGPLKKGWWLIMRSTHKTSVNLSKLLSSPHLANLWRDSPRIFGPWLSVSLPPGRMLWKWTLWFLISMEGFWKWNLVQSLMDHEYSLPQQNLLNFL